MKKELLDILACPKCKEPLALKGDETGLICKNCELLFKIEDNIPILLIEKAEKYQES